MEGECHAPIDGKSFSIRDESTRERERENLSDESLCRPRIGASGTTMAIRDVPRRRGGTNERTISVQRWNLSRATIRHEFSTVDGDGKRVLADIKREKKKKRRRKI